MLRENLQLSPEISNSGFDGKALYGATINAPFAVNPKLSTVYIDKLPWPPTINTYWRTPRKGPLAGRTLISEKGRAYRKAVIEHVRARPRHPTLKGRMAIAVMAYLPDRRRRDLDNITKALFDSMVHAGVMADDSQIDLMQVARGPIEKGGSVWVVYGEIEGANL